MIRLRGVRRDADWPVDRDHALLGEQRRFLTRPSRGRSRRPRGSAALGGTVLLAVLLVLASGGLLGAPPAGAASPSGSLELTAGSPWLTGTNGFRLQVQINSSLPAPDLELSLELFPEVLSRSAFEQALTGQPVATVQQALTIPLVALGDQSNTGPTSLSASTTLPVTSGINPPSTTSPGAPTLTLACDLNPSESAQPCDGVYPLEVSLADRAGVPLASFTTYGVYA